MGNDRPEASEGPQPGRAPLDNATRALGSPRLNQSLLDALPYPAMLVRRDRIVLAANRVAREMGAVVCEPCWMGIARAEHIPEAAKARLREGQGPPPDTHCVFCRAEEALDTGQAVRSPDLAAFGRVWDVLWVPLDDQVCLHYAIDATDYRRTERTLRRERDKAQQYLDIAGVILVVIEADQTLSLINRKGCEVLGVTEQEALGANWFDHFVPPRCREQVRETFVRLMAGEVEPVERYENPVLSRHGEERLIAWHNTVLRDRDGAVTATLSSGEDITEMRRTEEQLRHTVGELERSNADLEQFAYVVSHDLQEPLVVISGYAQLLARRYRESLEPEAQDYLSRVVGGVARMEDLIQDVLAYARLGTAQQPHYPVDCNKVLEDVRGRLRHSIEASGAELTAEPLPTVRGDAAQLGQLFQNLLSNALKFHGEAPPRVRVGAWREGEAWHFAVRDNGIGFSSEEAERIFAMCQRLHKASEVPGTGVGLAICKRVVERHGGEIWAESEPGQGSTFHFTLPAMPDGPA